MFDLFVTAVVARITLIVLIKQTSGTVELPAPVSGRNTSRGTSASPKPLPKAPGSKSSSPSPGSVAKGTASSSKASATATASSATQDLLGLGKCFIYGNKILFKDWNMFWCGKLLINWYLTYSTKHLLVNNISSYVKFIATQTRSVLC